MTHASVVPRPAPSQRRGSFLRLGLALAAVGCSPSIIEGTSLDAAPFDSALVDEALPDHVPPDSEPADSAVPHDAPPPPPPATNEVEINTTQEIALVPDLYCVDDSGWGEIVLQSTVAQLSDAGVSRTRLLIDLHQLCGNSFGDWHWDFPSQPGVTVGFLDTVKQVRAQGWSPFITVMLHEGLSAATTLPSWFHGEANDNNQLGWFRFNLDGTPGNGQLGEMTTIMQAVAQHLVDNGISRLLWETIGEMGHTMALVDIHYYVGRGIKNGDPTALLMGPATWHGWTAEEKFVKPYLAKYGPELLDVVSMHWYTSLDQGLQALGYAPSASMITMANQDWLRYLLDHTTEFADATTSLRALLDTSSPGKRIGIAYTEFNAGFDSCYGRNPPNPDYPAYRAASDCYINSNYFGAVWDASSLANTAARGHADLMCRFYTLSYYGLLDAVPGSGFYRTPAWFGRRLLYSVAEMQPGRTMAQATATAIAPASSTVEAFAVLPAGTSEPPQDPRGVRAVIINTSSADEVVELKVSGLGVCSSWRVRRYLLDETRVAPFIGPAPGSGKEGSFEGGMDDSLSAQSLEPIDDVIAENDGDLVRIRGVRSPKVSLGVVTVDCE
jgi:hypothetical protein